MTPSSGAADNRNKKDGDSAASRPSVAALPAANRIAPAGVEDAPPFAAPNVVPPERTQGNAPSTGTAAPSEAGQNPPDSGMMVNPNVLSRPIEPNWTEMVPGLTLQSTGLLQTPLDAPLGFTGRSSVLPTESQQNDDFVPVEDRWRIGYPEWDRYGKGHPYDDDYPYVEGHWYDPYNQNVLKGDYPIIGQHTFLSITATTDATFNFRELPTATTPFESTESPGQREFFGNPHQFFYTQFFSLQTDLFHGNAGFKPVDWQIRITPVFNVNDLDVRELGVVSPNVLNGTNRFKDMWALEEYFFEAKLFDFGPNYDFVSIRAGSQPFVSDFRGFIFSDTNRAVRLFGTNFSNRDQFNLAFFDQAEKDTDSELNEFHDRKQLVVIANYYRQDFVFPGYTQEASFHWDHDEPSFHYDDNGFLVRPDPVGAFQEHEVDAYYFGLAGDGHIGPINVSDAFYWVVGRDTFNPMSGQKEYIDAQMAAIELSYDRDWVRFRASYFYASGDNNLNDRTAHGFDSIMDNPQFAGGEFSYWIRQAIPIFGVNLTNEFSLLPDLRSSKIDGQANFVNPGLQLLNVGMDFSITPKYKLITNANFLWFDTTEVLQQLLQQSTVHSHIGTDLSIGLEYRPLLNDNIIIVGGLALFLPGRGFDDIYGSSNAVSFVKGGGEIEVNPMYSNFLHVVMTY